MSKIENNPEFPIHCHQLSAREDGAKNACTKNRDDEFTQMVEELQYSPTRQISHARFHSEDVAYHVVSRIYWGFFRLVPTLETTAIINGVFARAREMFPDIKLYAAAVLSNHAHWQMQGKAEEVPLFIGYIKREISRRIGKEQGRSGPMWDGYDSIALPGPISERSSLRYILRQGVKEGLVERPEYWPGLHSAKSMLTGEPLRGIWLDGTGYARERDKEKRRAGGNPDNVDKQNYITETELHFDKFPRWAHLSNEDYAATIKDLIDEIVEEEREERGDAPLLGAEQVMRMHINTRKEWEPLPYHENRKRLVCWGPSHAAELQDYLAEYWEFQKTYKEASRRFREGELEVEFPEGAFRPSSFAQRPKRKAAA